MRSVVLIALASHGWILEVTSADLQGTSPTDTASKTSDLALTSHSISSTRLKFNSCMMRREPRIGRITGVAEVFALLLLASCPAGLWQLPAAGHNYGVAIRKQQEHWLRELRVAPRLSMKSGGFGAPRAQKRKSKSKKGKNVKKGAQAKALLQSATADSRPSQRQPLTAVSDDQPLRSVAIPKDVAERHERPAPTTAKEIIPRDVLFAQSQYIMPRVSPDGRLLVYSRLRETDSATGYDVMCRTIGQDDDRVLFSAGGGDVSERIIEIFWAQDSKTLLYLRDVNGDECFQLWSIDVSQMSAVARDLTPIRMTTREVIMNKRFPGEVLISARAAKKYDPSAFDKDAIVYRCNLESGEINLDTRPEPHQIQPIDRRLLAGEWPPHIVSYEVDPESFQVCAATLGGGVMLRKKNFFGQWSSDWSVTTAAQQIVAVAKDGKSVLAFSTSGRETAALVRLDMQNPDRRETIAANDKCDITEVLLDEDTKEVLAVSFDYARKERIFFDKELEAQVRKLEAAGPPGAEVEIFGRDPHVFNLHDYPTTIQTNIVKYISRGRKDEKHRVMFIRDDAPMEPALYDFEAAALTRLFPPDPVLKYKLAHMEDVRIQARDGTELVAYLTRADAQKATPLVLAVHGGPQLRDTWGFRPEAQWLANRGYAVLKVNFRGSSGYGESFADIGRDYSQWGIGVLQHDLTDAVAWAIKEGIALKDKICIFGFSYGGYATLSGMTFTPDLYACGISKAGISGAPERGPFVEKISPLFHADKVRSPILIAHGQNDVRVPKSHADQMALVLQKKELDVEYLSYKLEGHNIVQPDNARDFYGRVEHFLAEHLGGRAEAFWKPKYSTVSFPLSTNKLECSVIIPEDARVGQEIYYDLGPRGGHRRVRFVVPRGIEPGALIPRCTV